MREITLNPDQERARNTIDESCLVVACPGAGKTKLLEAKAAAILNRVKDARILAVTFTRDAADELKARITKTVGATLAERLICGTFHSVAIQQLKLSKQMGRIITESEQRLFYEMAYNQVCEEMGFDRLPENERVTLDDAIYILEAVKRRLAHRDTKDLPGNLLRAYNQLAKEHKIIDFQEILIRCVRGMRDGTVAPMNVTHVFADEFQDTDNVQYAWLLEHYRLLSAAPYSRTPAFTVVGDDDQSIYGWRNALGYQGMMRFVRDTKAKIITLGTNYRCRAEIVRSSDMVISNNSERVSKRFEAAKGSGGKVNIERFANKDDEARFVASIIARSVKANGLKGGEMLIPPREWAVLARSNFQLNKIESALLTYGIPFIRSSGDSLWDKKEIVVFLGFIKTLTGHQNSLDQVLSWCRVPSNAIRGLKKKFDGELLKIKDTALDFSKVEDHVRSAIEELQSALQGMEKALHAEKLDLVMCLARDLMVKYADSDKAVNNLKLAVDTLKRLKGPLHRRISYLTTAAESAGDKEDPNGVVLLTLHGSKGLEWNHVAIVGCEEKVIPSEKAMNVETATDHQYDAIAEERRLMFVGMTRARENLHMTYSIDRNQCSRFLRETGIVF